MNHQIKINRAQKITKVLPMASAVIWGSIPDSLINTLTSKELALVIDALNNHWHKAVAHTEKRIVGDGYVWSSHHQALLDIKFPER